MACRICMAPGHVAIKTVSGKYRCPFRLDGLPENLLVLPICAPCRDMIHRTALGEAFAPCHRCAPKIYQVLRCMMAGHAAIGAPE